MPAEPPILERGQLVEVEGLEDEGFPASFVQGIVLQTVQGGVVVEYLEFLDEVTGKQLIEYQPVSRFRPFLPSKARFTSWDDVQAGMSVELYEDDVWWKGLVLRKSPAGVFIYLPEVNQHMRFEKHLRNLRPGYDWVPVAAAEADEAAGAAADSSSDGQQQAFHWVRRIIDDDTLKHCNMEPKEVKAAAAKVPHPLPAELPFEPRFSEFVRSRDPADDDQEAVAAALAAAAEATAAEDAAAAAAAEAAAAATAAAAAAEAAVAAAAAEAAAAASQQAAATVPDAMQVDAALAAADGVPAAAAAAAAAPPAGGIKAEPAADTSGIGAVAVEGAVKMEVDSTGALAADDTAAAAVPAATATVKAEPGSAAQQSSDTGKLPEVSDQDRQQGLDVSKAEPGSEAAPAPAAGAAAAGAHPEARDPAAAAAAALAAAAPAAADVAAGGERHSRQASAGVSAAAAAAGASLQPRRTTRGAKSRIIYIDGVPVLKDNLYDLDSGEPSVFKKELADKPAVEPQGYSTVPPASPASARRQQQLQHMRQQRQQHNLEREERCLAGDAAASGGNSGGRAKGTKAQNAQQQARLKHNQGVKASANATAGLRAVYLASHLEQLRPFIAPNVAEHLAAAAASAPHVEPPEPPTTQPEQIKAVLRDYQLEGLSWMVAQHCRGLNSILADEMGLGKTLQSITFLAHLKWVMNVPGPHLVVVPLSVMSSWMTELARWCPDLRAVKLHTADPEERKRLKKEVLARPDSFDVAVTTYEMVTSAEFGRPIQSTITWRYLVLDEGHRVRNMDTLTAKALRSVQRGNVLLLTGTPLQNNMVELYGMLAFMYPDVFTTPGPFEAAFNLVKGTVDQEALSAAHYLLRPFCLRRLKSEVEVTLPPKVETRIAVPLSDQQIFWYRRLLLRNHEALAALEAAVTKNPPPGGATPGRGRGRWPRKNTSSSPAEAAAAGDTGNDAAAAAAAAAGNAEEAADAAANGDGGAAAASVEGSPAAAAAAAAAGDGVDAAAAPGGQLVVAQGNAWRRLLNLIMQLRKVVNHPFMMPDSEPRGDGTSTLPELLDASGKLSVLHRLLTKLHARGHRVVLFSQFTMMLGILEDYLSQAGFEYVRLDGSVSRVQRMISISQFNKPGSKISIFLASTRSGGLGLNLQTADTVILYDSDWNPQWDLQAMARVHRIGQTKPVHIYRLVTGSSVEERMLQRADAKLYLDQMVNRGSTARAQQLDGMSTGELLSMLSFGADRILANDAGQAPSDADLDTILDRSKDAAAAALAAEQQQQQLQGGEGSAGPSAAAAAGGDGGGSSRRSSAGDGGQQGDEEGGGGSSKQQQEEEAAAAGGGGHTILMPLQTTAATFQADAPPPSTFTLNGVDYSAAGLAKLRQEAEQEAAALLGNKAPLPTAGKRKRGRPAKSAVLPEPGDAEADGAADGDLGAEEGEEGAGASGLPATLGRRERKALHPAVRKLCGGRGGAADEEGVKAMLRSIGREYWEAQGGKAEGDTSGGAKPHRANKERTVIVDGYQVLKVNNYQMNEGGISAWEESTGGQPGSAPRKRKVQKAGRDYAHAEACQVCWDGGELVCCDVCPAAYHAECLGQDPTHLEAKQHWACPHHACGACGRGPAAAGGLLFRCGVCESAWCEDHLPAGHDILGDWPLFQALGQNHPTNACFILCGPDCQALKHRLDPLINSTIQHYTDNPELRFKEREDEPEQDEAQPPPAKKQKKGKKQRVQSKGGR